MRTCWPKTDDDPVPFAVELDAFEEALGRRREKGNARPRLIGGPELGIEFDGVLGRHQKAPVRADPRSGMCEGIGHPHALTEFVDESPKVAELDAKFPSVGPKVPRLDQLSPG